MTKNKEGNSNEIKISIIDALKKAMIIVIPMDIILFFIYYFIRGGYNILSRPWSIYFIIVLISIVGFVIHEILHGIILSFYSKKKFKDIEYGTDEEYLKPYCICREGLLIKEHKINRIIPIIVTGFLPYIISLIAGNFFLMIGSLVLICFCGIDLVVVLRLRKEKNETIITDATREAGYINYKILK